MPHRQIDFLAERRGGQGALFGDEEMMEVEPEGHVVPRSERSLERQILQSSTTGVRRDVQEQIGKAAESIEAFADAIDSAMTLLSE